ncbi:MAG: phage tail protein [Proteobacteria bacterium]|nr:MAG: phage tail protein [Pseudomonadota bacterium]
MQSRFPLLVLLGLSFAPAPTHASSEPFVGELMLTGHNFCPQGWAEAAGQILSIAQNQALFALLGTTFGGNGQTTFALPDLRGRVAMGVGQGPGLSNRTLGEQGGSETVTLAPSQMPAHTHTAGASTGPGNTSNPTNALPATKARTLLYRSGGSATTAMAPEAIQPAGGGQPHPNMPPYLTMTWCIALQGIFPQHP